VAQCANIQPESITSTINKKTSIEFARFFYFMAPKVESFVSLAKLMKANSIYSKSSVPLQRIIDRTRQKSLDELRQIITSRNISLLRRDELVLKDSTVLTIAERELKLCPPRSTTANETYTSHQRSTSSSSGNKGRPSAASNKRQYWNRSSSKASRSDTSPTKSDIYKRSKPCRMKEEKFDFLQSSIHENVCSNKLMIRTALKELTELQVIVDEKVSGKEAQVESIIFLSCRLDQLISKFVSFLNDNDESGPIQTSRRYERFSRATYHLCGRKVCN
jgi:hypothetical protein